MGDTETERRTRSNRKRRELRREKEKRGAHRVAGSSSAFYSTVCSFFVTSFLLSTGASPQSRLFIFTSAFGYRRAFLGVQQSAAMYQTNQQGQAYQVPPQQYSYDPEMGYGKTEEEGGYGAFMEKQVRQGFIRKVFGILAVQLLVTFSCAIGFASSAPLKAYVSQNMWPVYVAF